MTFHDDPRTSMGSSSVAPGTSATAPSDFLPGT